MRNGREIEELDSTDRASKQALVSTTSNESETHKAALGGLSDTLLNDGIVKKFLLSDVVAFERKLQELDSSLKSKKSWKTGTKKNSLLDLLEKYCEEIILRGERILARVNDRKVEMQVKKHFRAAISRWISRNPFMHRGLYKPRGYPGDYMMMEMGYDSAVASGASGLESELDRLCYKKYQAIPRRKDKLKELLIDYLEARDKKQHLRVLTLGGGPCREWLELDANRQKKWGEKRVELTYLDQDEEATDFSRHHLKRNHLISKVEYKSESLLSFVRSPKWQKRIRKYDLVYILGVGDYLGDIFLTDVIVQGLNLIQDSGKFIITQKDKARFDLTFLDWFCDWTFVKRSRMEFSCLLREAISRSDGNFKYEVVREDTGQIMFGIITRL